MKKCPYCAEEIQDEAIVCRYCGREMKSDLPPEDRKTCPYCAEWIRAQAVFCRYCGRELPTPSISKPSNANGDTLTASTIEEIQLIKEKAQLGEEEVEERQTPILIGTLLIGLLFAALASVPRLVGLAGISDSPAAFNMWQQNFAFHFISNWIIWSVVAAVFIVLWRRARDAFWGLLVFALLLLVFYASSLTPR